MKWETNQHKKKFIKNINVKRDRKCSFVKTNAITITAVCFFGWFNKRAMSLCSKRWCETTTKINEYTRNITHPHTPPFKRSIHICDSWIEQTMKNRKGKKTSQNRRRDISRRICQVLEISDGTITNNKHSFCSSLPTLTLYTYTFYIASIYIGVEAFVRHSLFILSVYDACLSISAHYDFALFGFFHHFYFVVQRNA